MVDYDYNNIKWTKKDDKEIQERYEEIKYYLNWVVIGILTCLLIVVVLHLFLTIFEIWGCSASIWGFVLLR